MAQKKIPYDNDFDPRGGPTNNDRNTSERYEALQFLERSKVSANIKCWLKVFMAVVSVALIAIILFISIREVIGRGTGPHRTKDGTELQLESNGNNSEKFEKGCEDGWTVFESSCYFFGNEDMTFSHSESFCKSMDKAHLVNIETAAENTFLQNFLRVRKATTHWIGMTDEETENVWKHVPSGANVTFFAWFYSQPNNGRVSNCMAFWQPFDYLWADEPCSRTYNPICEKRIQ